MNPIDQEPEDSFWKRHRLTIGGAVVVLAGVGFVVKFFSETKMPARTERPVMMVSITPPPPAPPPPPPPPPPPEPPREEMVKQETISEPEPKPDEKPEPPKAPDEPPAVIGTNVQGDGPGDGFNLGGNGNGTGGSGPGGLGGSPKRGSKWGWYAGLVQTQIADALRKNIKTRTADLQLKLRLWSDASGRIERVTLVDSSGDSGLDQAIENEVLTGLRLSEPPPSDMPMPIVMRITARRPN